jgi:4-carboxymuconolactone decarboxylase
MSLRLAPIPQNLMSEAQQRVADKLISGPRGAVRGPFPALLRNPELADCARALGDCVRSSNTLPLALYEIAVLVVARHWKASYEWGAHVKVALNLGLAASVIADIKAETRPTQASAEQAAVYDFCTAVLKGEDVNDVLYDEMLAHFGERGIIDLLGILGYASFACMIFNTARVPTANTDNNLRP